MRTLAFCVLALSILGVPSLSAASISTRTETALDRYVARPDPHYRYELVRTFSGAGYTGYVLSMTSQQWRTAREVDRPVWRHWLVIVRPDKVATHTGLLVVSGGSNDRPPPHDINPLLIRAVLTTGSVVGEIRMVPNEPLTFADYGRPLSEDAIIAYSWRKFLATGDETWPLRLPMTQSVVRAMDTVTSFCASPKGGAVRIDKFVLGGASKRGWTAWSAAAVDPRVVAVVPVVIDLLNIEASFEHQYRAYGFWAPAIAAFEHAGIMRGRGTPRFAALMRIEDPYAYRDRLTMPKFIVNSAGDQYFLPDSSQFYFAGLKGETYLRYVPNTDHRLRGSDAADSALAFYQSIVAHTPRPRFTWRFQQDGAIRVETEMRPIAVKLWQAHNPDARDFRLASIGPAYTSTDLTDRGDSVYVGRVPQPQHGWTAYFVEMTFAGPGAAPFKFTTGVRVTPDRLPYGPPPKENNMTDPEPASRAGR